MSNAITTPFPNLEPTQLVPNPSTTRNLDPTSTTRPFPNSTLFNTMGGDGETTLAVLIVLAVILMGMTVTVVLLIAYCASRKGRIYVTQNVAYATSTQNLNRSHSTPDFGSDNLLKCYDNRKPYAISKLFFHKHQLDNEKNIMVSIDSKYDYPAHQSPTMDHPYTYVNSTEAEIGILPVVNQACNSHSPNNSSRQVSLPGDLKTEQSCTDDRSYDYVECAS